jgi:hypothetical protein
VLSLKKENTMTALKRNALASSLVAAGWILSGGLAQAAELDVSSIYGRGSPPNAHITAVSGNFDGASSNAGWSSANADGADAEYGNAATDEPAVQSAYPEHASQTIYPYPETTSEPVSVAQEATTIHEETLDGVPLVEGRGMREDVDPYAAAPVHSEAAYDVREILGRASPPAPEDAPNFGLPS